MFFNDTHTHTHTHTHTPTIYQFSNLDNSRPHQYICSCKNIFNIINSSRLQLNLPKYLFTSCWFNFIRFLSATFCPHDRRNLVRLQKMPSYITESLEQNQIKCMKSTRRFILVPQKIELTVLRVFVRLRPSSVNGP